MSEAVLEFQQDGTPAHYAIEEFPARQIGRQGPMRKWPPRSPDLTTQCRFKKNCIIIEIFKTKYLNSKGKEKN